MIHIEKIIKADDVEITKDNFINDEKGNTYLRYYDSECKVWMNVFFEPDGKGCTEELMRSLKILALKNCI